MTIQFAIEIGRGSKISKDHTQYLSDFDGWMMSNPGMINGFVTIHTDDESILMLKMPYIHYIDVKSNEQ